MKADFEKGTKVCSSIECILKGVEQSINNFHKDKYQVDGLKSECKTCSNRRDTYAYSINKEGNKKRSKEWKNNNPEILKSAAKYLEKCHSKLIDAFI